MPKKGRGKAGDLDPLKLPTPTADRARCPLRPLRKDVRGVARAGIATPPVFIVVCNNTATSKLVYEWISGWERQNEDGELVNIHQRPPRAVPQLRRARQPPRPAQTLLIDSEQLESGEALDRDFREMAAPEIEQFKRELQRSTALAATRRRSPTRTCCAR